MDVVQRLEPVVIEIERERECVCVVAHQAILRAIYGYFTKTPLKARAGRAERSAALWRRGVCREHAVQPAASAA
jgi:broad specificity phosphatase PhoE